MRFPTLGLPPLPVVHNVSLEALALGAQGNWSAAASGGFAAANLAYFVPFHLDEPLAATLLYCLNGSSVSGNIDVGIYDASYTRIVSSGSTTQAGTNTIQTFDIADTLLGAGDFYLAVAMDNNSGALFRLAVNLQVVRRAGQLQQLTAFPLPAVATPVAMTVGATPMIGIRQGGTVI